MAYVCLQADELRVFMKNGKLRFQARQTDQHNKVLEQVTVTLPNTLAEYFTRVENLDGLGEGEETILKRNRIGDLFKDH